MECGMKKENKFGIRGTKSEKERNSNMIDHPAPVEDFF